MISKFNYKPIVLIISLIIPFVIGMLYLMPKGWDYSEDIHVFPRINAIINGTTFFVLIAAFVAIRKKNVHLHKRLMILALILSALFLISYVIYHSIAESTPYGGEGFGKAVYLFILLTHILLSMAIVPLVLISLSRALTKKYDKHRKIARITLPIWLYVTLTGVIVYLMISPYY